MRVSGARECECVSIGVCAARKIRNTPKVNRRPNTSACAIRRPPCALLHRGKTIHFSSRLRARASDCVFVCVRVNVFVCVRAIRRTSRENHDNLRSSISQQRQVSISCKKRWFVRCWPAGSKVHWRSAKWATLGVIYIYTYSYQKKRKKKKQRTRIQQQQQHEHTNMRQRIQTTKARHFSTIHSENVSAC